HPHGHRIINRLDRLPAPWANPSPAPETRRIVGVPRALIYPGKMGAAQHCLLKVVGKEVRKKFPIGAPDRMRPGPVAGEAGVEELAVRRKQWHGLARFAAEVRYERLVKDAAPSSMPQLRV